MSISVKKMYEGYWSSKKGLENFEDYERNLVLRKIFKKDEKILDVASGEGAVSQFLSDLGCEVVAFDISEEALKKVNERGIKGVRGDIEKKLPFKTGEFDGVFWGDNVEHLFLPLNTALELNRIIKKGGRLVISCPNMGYWRYRLSYLFKGMVPQTEWYGENPWVWEHIRFFNKKVMTNFLNQSRFNLKSFYGVSRRRLDKPFLNMFPEVFGMIMVVVAVKKDE